MSRLGSEFSDQHEFIDDDVVQYAYCMLQPVASDCAQLDLFISYLRKSDAVCFIFSISAQLILL